MDEFQCFFFFLFEKVNFFIRFLVGKEFSINFALAIDPWCNWQHVWFWSRRV